MTLRLIANRARTQADWLISLVKTRASARTFDLRTHFSEGAASNEQLNLRNVPNPLTTQSKAGRCGSFASVGCSRWGQAAAESAVVALALLAPSAVAATVIQTVPKCPPEDCPVWEGGYPTPAVQPQPKRAQKPAPKRTSITPQSGRRSSGDEVRECCANWTVTAARDQPDWTEPTIRTLKRVAKSNAQAGVHARRR